MIIINSMLMNFTILTEYCKESIDFFKTHKLGYQACFKHLDIMEKVDGERYIAWRCRGTALGYSCLWKDLQDTTSIYLGWN